MTSARGSEAVVQADPHPANGFRIRGAAFLPARVAYLREVVLERLGLDPNKSQLLVVGPVQGGLAGGLAELGFTAATFDPVEGGGRLPYGDRAFDVTYYHDTFETTDDLDGVLREAFRILRFRGVLVYDAVNRTALSKLIYLGALQSWRWTRIMPRGRYAPERLRPPDELATAMSKHGLRNHEVRALVPASPLGLLRALRRGKRGDFDDSELARLAGMHVADSGKPPEVTYLGFATKE
jgi:2-polyprenyl-6-hydroxyphenyl methylase/3-demethylubiquinone-9 3-methyltransferase